MTKEELKLYKPKYENGNIYMTDNGIEHCVMYGNEEPFIKESIRQICQRIKPKSVIELGYGLGFTAQQFQDEGVTTHIIYEPNDFIFKEAEKWAKGKAGVRVINDTFRDGAIPDKVDLLYNDIYDMTAPNYDMSSYDELKELFNFDWYAEFCVDYQDGYEIDDKYFRFDNKIQLLIQNNGNL